MNYSNFTDDELRAFLVAEPSNVAAQGEALHRFCNPRIELAKAHREMRQLADLLDRINSTSHDIEMSLSRLVTNLDTE